MKKDKILPRKKSFKFIITNLFFIGLLAILYLSSNISIFTFGFLLD